MKLQNTFEEKERKGEGEAASLTLYRRASIDLSTKRVKSFPFRTTQFFIALSYLRELRCIKASN